jgi:hypothetical protein
MDIHRNQSSSPIIMGSSPPPITRIFLAQQIIGVNANYGALTPQEAQERILGYYPLISNYRNPFHDTDGKMEINLNQHPLEIIFSFLDLPSLLRCRLVNKRWKDVSKSMWGMQIQSVANTILEISQALSIRTTHEQQQIVFARPLEIAEWKLPFGKKKLTAIESVEYVAKKTGRAMVNWSEITPQISSTTKNIATGLSVVGNSIAPYIPAVNFQSLQLVDSSSPLTLLFEQVKARLIVDEPKVSTLLKLTPKLKNHFEERAFGFFLSEMTEEIALKSDYSADLLPYGSNADYPSLLYLKSILRGLVKSQYAPKKLLFALSELSGVTKYIDDCIFLSDCLPKMKNLSHLSFFNHERDSPSPIWGRTSNAKSGLNSISIALSRIPNLTHFCWGVLPGFRKIDIEPLLRMIAQREAQPTTTRLEQVVIYDPILEYPEYMPLLLALDQFKGKPKLQVITTYEMDPKFKSSVEQRCPFIKFDTTRSAFLKDPNPWWWSYG